MKKITNVWIGVCAMAVVSVLSLLVVSALVFVFKWQASKAMIGIMITYVLAGVGGGLAMRWYSGWEKRRQRSYGVIDENTISMKEKVVECFCASAFFIVLLWGLSIFGGNEGSIEVGRFFLVWMLLFGSLTLARIL